MRHSESTGARVIDWKDELINRKMNQFERMTWASNWETCVCGQMDSMIPRHISSHSPRDSHLASLGSEFVLAIGSENDKEALRICRSIHDRCDQLGYPIPGEEINESETKTEDGQRDDKVGVSCRAG